MLCSHPLSLPSVPLTSYEESICADTPQTIKELKDTDVGEIGHLISVDRAIAYPKSARLPEVTPGMRELKWGHIHTPYAADDSRDSD